MDAAAAGDIDRSDESAGMHVASESAAAAAAPSAVKQPQSSHQAAAAAAGSRPSLSPARRCDSDSLSLALSFLNTRDFLRAVSVCRQWHSAGLHHSAWPKLHLPTLIQSLRDDKYNDLAKRRLVVVLKKKQKDGSDESRLATLLAGSAFSSSRPAAAAGAVEAVSMWRHVAVVEMRVDGHLLQLSSEQRLDVCHRAMDQSAQLPCLSVLQLQHWAASDQAVSAFYSAVAGRLQALLLSDCTPSLCSHLPLLLHLRVLVLDCQPAAADLAPLHRLEYLHFNPQYWVPPRGLMPTLRWLSTEHSLRSLSVRWIKHDAVRWEPLFRPPQPLQGVNGAGGGPQRSPRPSAAADGLPVVDWTKPCDLTDVSMAGRLETPLLSSICALPHLTRLKCESNSGIGERAEDLPPATALAKLEQLSLLLRWVSHGWRVAEEHAQIGWRHLQQCSRLRVLQLSFNLSPGASQLAAPAADLQRVLGSCADTLEELRLDASIRIEHGVQAASAAAAASSAASSSAQPAAAAAVGSAAAQTHSPMPSNGWDVLARCIRLRVLEMGLQPDTADSGMLEALVRAPSFQSLHLTLPLRANQYDGWSVQGLPLPPQLLQCINHSRSWRGLHLYGLVGRSILPADVLRAPLGLPAQMPAAAASEATVKRLRVCIHDEKSGRVRSFGIHIDADGAKSWQHCRHAILGRSSAQHASSCTSPSRSTRIFDSCT